jgi:murein DD-endopeptidase MepM/ murein hydrolase activator NlpD
MKRIILCALLFTVACAKKEIKIVQPIKTKGIITSVLGKRWGTVHTGIDIGAKKGTLVRSLTDGIVTRASYDKNFGNRINIYHPELGLYSSYSHLSRMNYKENDKILAGDIIGTVGNTGHSTGPHLHYEIYSASATAFLNPLSIIGNVYLYKFKGKKIEIAQLEKKNEIEEKNIDELPIDEIY